MSADGASAFRGIDVSEEGRLLLVEARPLGESEAGGWLLGLRRLCEQIAADDEVRVLLLSMGALAPGAQPERACDARALVELSAALAATPHVTIVALDRDCFDAELCLALACDLRVARAAISLGFPGVRAGLLPDDATIRRLATLTGRSRVAELLLTGRAISGTTAAEWGLIEEAVEVDTALLRARALAGEIMAGAPLAMRYAKEAVDRGFSMPLQDGLALEGDLYAILQTTEDRLEGIDAFRARRSPRYVGH